MADIDSLPDYYLPTGATGTYEVKTRNGNGSISFAVGDDDVMFSADSEQNTTVDQSLALAGLLSSEIERYKNTLLDNSKYNVQNSVVVPTSPSSSPLLSQMKVANDLKLKSYEIENLKLKADVEYKKTDIQIKLKDLELREKEIALKETEIYMQSKFYEQNERIIKQKSTLIKNLSHIKTLEDLKLSEMKDNTAEITKQANIIKSAEDAKLVEMKNHIQAVKEQQFNASFGDVSVTMNTDVLNQNTAKTAEAIEKIAVANEKIAEGVDDQKGTNEKIVENLDKENIKLDKQIEHFDFQKEGTPDLKDSEGNVIKPREVQAKKDAEQFIEKEDLNKTTIEEIMEFNQDVRQFLDDYSPDALVTDAVGSTDGFSADLNPLAFFDNLLKEEYETNKDKYPVSSTPIPNP